MNKKIIFASLLGVALLGTSILYAANTGSRLSKVRLKTPTAQSYQTNSGYSSGSHEGMMYNNQSQHAGMMNDCLSGVALQTLSSQEKLDLAYQYSEEMVARDLYNYFYTLYKAPQFQNVAKSESQHMTAVKNLLERYDLDTPTGYRELQDEFDALKAEGAKGLQEALEVGIKVEMLDIQDIKDTIKTTDNDDIKLVFTNIGGASYNHMRGFVMGLKNNNLTTDIDYSAYLSDTEVAPGVQLQEKLRKELTAEGITLPEQLCDKPQGTMKKMSQNKSSTTIGKGSSKYQTTTNKAKRTIKLKRNTTPTTTQQ